jgi:hypothetical protein
MNFPMRRRRRRAATHLLLLGRFCCELHEKNGNPINGSMEGYCAGVVRCKNSSAALLKGAQNKKSAIQVCLPAASPTEYLEYFTCCAGVKDAADHARQHDAPLSYILPLPPPENLLLCCEE